MAVGKKDEVRTRKKWKMRACGGCVRVDRLDNSVSVSQPSRGWVTGRVLRRIKLLKLETLASEAREERGHCSLLLNQERATPFFFPRRAAQASELDGAKDVSGLLKAGTDGWAHKNPG